MSVIKGVTKFEVHKDEFEEKKEVEVEEEEVAGDLDDPFAMMGGMGEDVAGDATILLRELIKQHHRGQWGPNPQNPKPYFRQIWGEFGAKWVPMDAPRRVSTAAASFSRRS